MVTWRTQHARTAAVAMLALCALCAECAAASAQGTSAAPVIQSYSPYEGMPNPWGGNAVIVTATAATSEGQPDPIGPARCSLWINGRLIASKAPIVSTAFYGSTVQFTGLALTASNETLQFKVEVVTQSGLRASKEWSYAVEQAKPPGLINVGLMRHWFGYIAKGAIITVELTVISMALACVLALLGSLGRLSRKMSYRQAWNKHRSWAYMVGHTVRMTPYWIATAYTSLFRGTPLLLQIVAIYFAIPAFIDYMSARWGVWENVPYPNAFVSGVAALSLNYGAYLTEVFRAGIQAVPRGQMEAAWALGMTGWQTQHRIVLPQAFKIVIPAIGNDFIALIKDTSLVSIIAVSEVLHQAQMVGSRTYDYLSPLLVAAAVYWALTIFFSFWQAKLERRLERDRART